MRTRASRATAAVGLVALAFGLGYGVRRQVEDDGDATDAGPTAEDVARVGVTFREAASVTFDTSRRELLRRFSGKPYERRPGPGKDVTCFVYVVSDRPSTAWSFCFQGGRLKSSSTSPVR